MVLTKENLLGICNIISATLQQKSSVDTKMHVLEGLMKDINIASACPKIYVKSENGNVLLFPSKNSVGSFHDSRPSFFLQDYDKISDNQLENFIITKEGTGPYFFEPIITVSENLEKRMFLVFVVLHNEIERLKQQKKGKWEGTVWEEKQDLSLEITKEQEREIVAVCNRYKIGEELATFELMGIIKNCDLSCFYKYKGDEKKPSDIVRVHSVIVAIDKILGRNWSRNAAYATTKVLADGPRTFEQIQKNYRSSDNF